MKLNERELQLIDWALDMLYEYYKGVERDDEADEVEALRLTILKEPRA